MLKQTHNKRCTARRAVDIRGVDNKYLIIIVFYVDVVFQSCIFMGE